MILPAVLLITRRRLSACWGFKMAITGSTSAKNTGRIRYGMVGGGQGAFIGAVHRIAARIDDKYEFVAGALSRLTQQKPKPPVKNWA